MTVDREVLREAASRTLGPGPLSMRQTDQVDDTVGLVERACRNWAVRDPQTWATEVVLLDIGRANTALTRLIRTHATVPAYAAFFAVYETLHTELPVAVRDCCSDCEGTGWVECVDDRRHARWCRHRGTAFGDSGDCFCSSSVPCQRCRDGAAAERSMIWRERDGCP